MFGDKTFLIVTKKIKFLFSAYQLYNIDIDEG